DFVSYVWAGRWCHNLPPLAPEPAKGAPRASQPIAGEPLPPFVAEPSQWLIAIVSIVLVALLIAGIWYFWRRSQPAANPVPALAQAAIESIQAGGDVQSIV